MSKDYKHIRTALFPFGNVIKHSVRNVSLFPEFWMRYMGLMDFHWRMICFSLSFSLTFPLYQTISIVSQISYKLSDLIYKHISIINYHSYVVPSRIDLVVYCYWILWLLRNKTNIISTVITHNQQKKNVYTVEVLLCFENKCFFSKIPILKSY